MYSLDDTIVAIASAPGGAARGIVRLSGPDAHACLRATLDRPLDPEPLPNRPLAVAGAMRLAGVAAPLPCELYLWPEGRSYTGQPVAEVHTLGSPPLLEAAVAALCRAGARLAGPGEFTMRAFLAGRIDLTQAEAVLGVIDAAGPGQLDVALRQLAGGLAGPMHRLRDDLLDLLADLEAGFDFADEDLPLVAAGELRRRLAEAAGAVARIARQMGSRAEAGEIVQAVLVGRPNTGKSSLFNALASGAGALVSELPGTTRDYLVAELELDGARCRLVDTAGMVAAEDLAEDEIGRAARQAASQQDRAAQIQLLCLDATRPPDAWETAEIAAADGRRRLLVLTKIDAAPGNEPAEREALPAAIATSSLTGEGLASLREALRGQAAEAANAAGEVVATTAIRCRESLDAAAGCLGRAEEILAAGHGEELVAAEIRAAIAEVGSVVGAVFTDDLLDRIFARFCIGK